jgi:putative transposase
MIGNIDEYYWGTVRERGNWNVIERFVREQGKPKKELMQLSMF